MINNFSLKKKQMNFGSNPFVCLFVAPPRRGKKALLFCQKTNVFSGKSYLIRYLNLCWAREGRFKRIWVISTTGKWNGDYDYLDSKYISDTYSDDHLQFILDTQRENEGEALLIFDDAIGEAQTKTSMFKQLISTHRQYNLSVILSVQNLLESCTPLIRNCARFVVFFRPMNLKERKALFENYGSNWENLNEFNAFCKNVLRKHKFVFYDEEKDSYTVNKAPPDIPKFKLIF
jgi:hypothetical protein